MNEPTVDLQYGSGRMGNSPGRILTVFGITGQTGRTLAVAGAARGWTVRGFIRPGTVAPADLSDTQIVSGDFSDHGRVLAAVGGAAAVCVVIGPRPPYSDVFCATATGAVVEAMRRTGVRRLVCQTGAMIGPGNRTRLFEWMARAFARRQPAGARDRVDQERIVEASGLEWTIVKPPRLTNGAARGAVVAGPAVRVGLLSSLSRADLAGLMLDAIEQSRHVGVRLFVRQR